MKGVEEVTTLLEMFYYMKRAEEVDTLLEMLLVQYVGVEPVNHLT